jgi:hypothetical protein
VSVAFDSVYIAGVVTAESGGLCGSFGLSTYACAEMLKAQAVAARTYVMRAIQSDPTLGTSSKPIRGGPCFQAWTANAGASEIQAATDTASTVMTYGGSLIDANYDAGGYAFDGSGNPEPPAYYHSSPYSSWSAAHSACCGSSDPSLCVFPGGGDGAGVWTQIFVTDNHGKTGSAVSGTCQASTGTQNRGAYGQNWAAELALLWVDGTFTYQDILSFFYGADVVFDGAPTVSKDAGVDGAIPVDASTADVATSPMPDSGDGDTGARVPATFSSGGCNVPGTSSGDFATLGIIALVCARRRRG